MIRDAYGRPLATLRVAVTEKCNFRCVFCHSEGVDSSTEEMNVEDYRIIAKATSLLGISYVKFTGGEPLLRKDLEEIISIFKENGFREVSLTTNGFSLASRAHALKSAGLDWVNVSLHSLRRERFAKITGVDALDRVIRGIEEALLEGIEVRINIVVLKGINDDEVVDVVKFALDLGASVHVIELHPVGRGAKVFKEFHASEPMKALVNWLERVAEKKEVRPLHNRPRYYIGDSFVEIIEPVGNPYFCAGCSRLRLSPDGKFYPCINVSDMYFNSLPILRSNSSPKTKVERVIEGILELNDFRKPYYMWNIEYERRANKRFATDGIKRIDLPRRAKLQFLRLLRVTGGRREAELRGSALRVQGSPL